MDTGADISILPKKFKISGQSPMNYKLFAANGLTISTYGHKLLTLELGLRKSFQ